MSLACEHACLAQNLAYACFPRGRRVQTTCHKFDKFGKKNVNILEFHGHIWIHHEKCIQKSTNMPSIIGSLICEIDFWKYEKAKTNLFSIKPMPVF